MNRNDIVEFVWSIVMIIATIFWQRNNQFNIKRSRIHNLRKIPGKDNQVMIIIVQNFRLVLDTLSFCHL